MSQTHDLIEQLKIKEKELKQKDLEIQTLKSNYEMKESQIETINSIIKTKDDQIDTLKSSLELKNEQIKSFKESLEMKEKEIQSQKDKPNDSINIELVSEKDKMIKQLQEEIKILNMDIKISDEEIEKLKSGKRDLSAGNSGTIIQNNVNRDEIINFIIKMLERSLHNVNLTTPSIIDLAELQLYDVRGTVNIKASCSIESNDADHQELLQEFEALDNIAIRNFTDKDRWICLKDSEEMFIGAVGEKGNNLAIYSNDSAHIKLFNSLIMESWLRARKL